MLLLEYLLRRRDVRPSILFELHEPLERRQILSLSFVVHDVGHVFLFHFLPSCSSVDAHGRNSDRPSGIADRDQDIRVICFHKFSSLAVRDHLEERTFDGRLQPFALAEPARSI